MLNYPPANISVNENRSVGFTCRVPCAATCVCCIKCALCGTVRRVVPFGTCRYCVRILPCVACSPNGTVLANLTAADPDLDPWQFVLVDDGGGPFTVTPSGSLYVDTTKGWLNYENVSLYTIVIRVQEVSNRVNSSRLLRAVQGDSVVWVTVNNLPEAPYYTSPLLPDGVSSFAFYENATAGIQIGTVAFDEQDAGCGSTVELRDLPSSLNAQTFAVSPSGTVTLLQPVVFEVTPAFNLSVRATDSCDSSLYMDVHVVISVLHLNKPPVLTCLTNSIINVDEAFVGVVDTTQILTAYDPDNNDTLHFVVTSNLAVTPIVVEPIVTGVHTFDSYWNITEPQPPSALQLQVRLQDADGLFATATCNVIFNFQQINHAPVLHLTTASVSVHELAPAGTLLLPLSATDHDVLQDLTFSLAPSDPYVNMGLFMCNSTARGIGYLYLALNHLDYELAPAYNLTVRVTDDGKWVVPSVPPQLFDDQVVTVYVIDDVDTPIVFSVTGGSSFGLSTNGGEFVTITGRYFGAANPGVVLPSGQSWVDASGAQINLQVGS